VYVEGPETVEQLKQIGKAFKGEHLATSVLENGGKTPWLPPEQFGEMGYTMLLYPTTILFRVARALQRAAADLRAGKPLDRDEAVDMKSFLRMVELDHWQEIEKKFGPG
jgi:2-methylisocitrate lyase-like PEP mutase family enzyme